MFSRRRPAGVVEKRVVNSLGEAKSYRYVRIRFKDHTGRLRSAQARVAEGETAAQVRKRLRQKVLDARGREQFGGFLRELLRVAGSEAQNG